MTEDNEIEEIRYNFLQVRINGKPTPIKCYEAILEKYTDENNISL